MCSEGGANKIHFFMDVFAPVERRNINFAVVFGNHDSGMCACLITLLTLHRWTVCNDERGYGKAFV